MIFVIILMTLLWGIIGFLAYHMYQHNQKQKQLYSLPPQRLMVNYAARNFTECQEISANPRDLLFCYDEPYAIYRWKKRLLPTDYLKHMQTSSIIQVTEGQWAHTTFILRPEGWVPWVNLLSPWTAGLYLFTGNYKAQPLVSFFSPRTSKKDVIV
jgi:hypothetical protein